MAHGSYDSRMNQKQKPTPRLPVVISKVEADETIVETIYRPDTAETAFAVARLKDIQIVPTWQSGDTTYAPIRPHNNLIKHGAVQLPSDVGEYESTAELLLEIEQHIARYVSLPSQGFALSSAYIMLSWVYDAFNEVPYLRFRGDYGTGKTRALIVIGSLCYKPFFASGASTVSPIFHTLDFFAGTLIFDEADFRYSDEKAELTKILNNGNVKGFPVLRTQVTPNNEFDPRAFAVFGPKLVGMRRSYEDRALESRFLTVEMEPGRAAGVPFNMPDTHKDEALALRNKLLMYRFRNRFAVRLNPDLAAHDLEPRMNQILLPLLSVMPSDELRETIMGMARKLQAGIVTERGSSAEGQAVSILKDVPSQVAVSLADITATFIKTYGAEYQQPITNRWIGAILRRLGITLYKSNGIVVIVPGQVERIAALVERYGVGDASAENSEHLEAARTRIA